jgi:hypothetical protein
LILETLKKRISIFRIFQVICTMKKSFVLLLIGCLPVMGNAQILLHDAFDDNSKHWFTGDNPESKFRIDSGYYHIETGGTVESKELDTTISKAFFASCSARLVKGKPKASYGFFLQSYDKTTDRKIFFLVNPSGMYSCFMQKPDGTFPLARWTPSPYIYKGSEWNILSLTGDSSRLNLYINDFYVRSFDNPFFHYNFSGVATFDTSIVDFNEIIVFAYPKLDKIFGVDYYNLPDVISFLLKSRAEGFKKLKGKELPSADHSEKMHESILWIPGAKDCFITDKTFKAVFGSYDDAGQAKKTFFMLRDKMQLAVPGSDFDEGLDDSGLPYSFIGTRVNDSIPPPNLELYITSQQETDGRKSYVVALDIK